MWHPKYSACTKCLSVEFPFRSRGLCTPCYAKDIEARHLPDVREGAYGSSASILTREFLESEYLAKGNSIGEIAKLGGCSRQYVHKKLKEFGIALRSLKGARGLALSRNKISYSLGSGTDQGKVVDLAQVSYDTTFFKRWTPEMAWVLGVIYSDGNLSDGITTSILAKTTTRNPTLNIAQKEPELLEKVRTQLKCNARLSFRKRREFKTTTAGEVYLLRLDATPIWEDLHRLGLYPNKSLTIRFPETIPDAMVRHFVRGCWDGDGSIFQQADGRHVAHYVSGSEDFIIGLVESLRVVGFIPPTIYTTKGSKNPAYYFKVFGAECASLFRFLYDEVPESMYLGRKAIRFQQSHDAAVRKGTFRERSFMSRF